MEKVQVSGVYSCIVFCPDVDQRAAPQLGASFLQKHRDFDLNERTLLYKSKLFMISYDQNRSQTKISMLKTEVN